MATRNVHSRIQAALPWGAAGVVGLTVGIVHPALGCLVAGTVSGVFQRKNLWRWRTAATLGATAIVAWAFMHFAVGAGLAAVRAMSTQPWSVLGALAIVWAIEVYERDT